MTDPDNRPDPAELLSGLLQGTEDQTDRVEGGLNASNEVTEAIVNNIRLVDVEESE